MRFLRALIFTLVTLFLVFTLATCGNTVNDRQGTSEQTMTLIMIAVPASADATAGPWQVSVLAADTGGNPVKSAAITMKATAGAVTPSQGTTNSNGIFSSVISPPSSYSGEPVAISATSNNQAVAVNLTFGPMTREAFSAIVHRIARAKQASSHPLAETSTDPLLPMVVGTSGRGPSINPFLTPDSCYTQQALSTPVSVACQNRMAQSGIRQTVPDFLSTVCRYDDYLSKVTGISSCVGLVAVASGCASPETGVGEVVCAGGVQIARKTLAPECAEFLLQELAHHLKNRTAAATASALLDFVGFCEGPDLDGTVALICDAVPDYNGGVTGITGTNVDINPRKAETSLGKTIQFQAKVDGKDANPEVTWSVNGTDLGSGAVGTVSSDGLYRAPTTLPPWCSGLFSGTIPNFQCTVTVTATSRKDPTAAAPAVIKLTNPAPTIFSLDPGSLYAGSAGQTLTINGDGFLQMSTVTFAGVDHQPQFVNSHQVKISLTSSDLETAGCFRVVVTNPAPGGGTAAASFDVLVVTPPTAGFSMSSGTRSATENGTLRLAVASGIVPNVVFDATSRSTAFDSCVINGWTWTMDGSLLGSTATLAAAVPLGTHNVSLMVKDNCNSQSQPATGTIIVTSELKQPIWPMSGRDSQRTGLSPFVGPSTPPSSPAWTFAADGAVVGDLTVSSEGNIYFVTNTAVYAVKPDGNLYASTPLPNSPATGPAIDERNGYVYLPLTDPSGGWNVVRFDKELQSRTDVVHVSGGDGITNLIVGDDGTVYFSNGGRGASVIAAGTHTFSVGLCDYGNSGAPLVSSQTGAVYIMCQGQDYSSGRSGIFRLDGATGTIIANAAYSRGGTELMMDKQGHLYAGNQAFGGAMFTGSYDLWDSDLNHLGGTWMDYTTSRATLMPDGFSTVRFGSAYNGDTLLVFEGEHSWGIDTLGAWTGQSPWRSLPSSDTADNIYIGLSDGVACLNTLDGSAKWRVTTSDAITTQPVVSDNGLLYVGSNSGRIYAFGSPTAMTVSSIAMNK